MRVAPAGDAFPTVAQLVQDVDAYCFTCTRMEWACVASPGY